MFTSLIESLFKYLFRPKPLWDPQGLAFLIRSRNRIDSPLEQRRWQNGLNRLHSIEAEKNRNLALLKADPFNKGIQKKIEEIIQQKDVVESFKSALIDIPGGLDHVQRPFIAMEVNNYSVKALVDSGACGTAISPSCAESCGIMRLIDKRYNDIAHGVGTAKILGRVHLAQIKIGSLYLPCSFSVMEGLGPYLVLGSDMLKRHQTCIDFDKGALIIWDEEVPFLCPKEIMDEPTFTRPSGMRNGAVSGAVSQAPADGNPNAKAHANHGGADGPKDKKQEPTLASPLGTSNGAVSGAVSGHPNRGRATARSDGVPATTTALPRQPRNRPPTSHKRTSP